MRLFRGPEGSAAVPHQRAPSRPKAVRVHRRGLRFPHYHQEYPEEARAPAAPEAARHPAPPVPSLRVRRRHRQAAGGTHLQEARQEEGN